MVRENETLTGNYNLSNDIRKSDGIMGTREL